VKKWQRTAEYGTKKVKKSQRTAEYETKKVKKSQRTAEYGTKKVKKSQRTAEYGTKNVKTCTLTTLTTRTPLRQGKKKVTQHDDFCNHILTINYG
jgi:hypothetical protein